MTVASEASRSTHDGDGSNKDFQVGFAFHEASTIEVILIDADGTEHLQSLNSNYTVTGGISGGVAGIGTVKMITAPPIGSEILIRRKPQLTQTFDPVENDAFPSSSIETALDRLVTQVQYLKDQLSRAPLLKVSSSLLDQLELPVPVANAAIGWNTSANGLANVGSSASMSAAGAALVSAPSYASMRSLLDVEPGTDFLSPSAVAASYQPLDPELSALAALTSAANKLPYFSGSGAASLADFSSAGRALVDDADAAAQRATLGLGTAALKNTAASGDAVALLNVENTWSARQIIQGSDEYFSPVQVVSTHAGANAGPYVDFFRDSASPAANDLMGLMNFTGRDSAANYTQYCQIYGSIIDPTTTTKEARLNVAVMGNNNLVLRAYFQRGLVVGNPTGGDKGAGTINAAAVYDDNTLLSDYVFDKHRGEQGEYSELIQSRYDELDPAMFEPETFGSFWKQHGRLYGMHDFSEVVGGIVKAPVGDLVQRLWQAVELQAIHIDHLREEIVALKKA